MSHKKKHTAKVPPGNQPKGGPEPGETIENPQHVDPSAFQEQDPQRRIGEFTERGKPSFKQPGGLNDASHQS